MSQIKELKMALFKAGAEITLDCFCGFNEKPVMPIIKDLEKKLNKVAKEQEFIVQGSVRVFQKNGPLAKILGSRERLSATVSRSASLIFKVTTEDFTIKAYKKLETFANKNKLIIFLDLRCWRI